jgi:hypothetical protein
VTTPYRIEARLNEGLIRLSHPRYGMMLWNRATIRKSRYGVRRCEECQKPLESGAIAYRPITFGMNRMRRVCEACITAKENGKATSKPDANATEGPCFNCGTPCTSDDFCHGCKTFICEKCTLGSPMGFRHNPVEHLEYEDE